MVRNWGSCVAGSRWEMKIVIIGSGLAGVTSAWYLRNGGHDVTVVDRAPRAGMETSFANGGLLTPGMCEPWNAPDAWRVLLASLVRSDAPLQLRMHALPSLLRWGTIFLKNSSRVAYVRHHRSNLRLSMFSLTCMQRLRDQAQIDYGSGVRGSLGIFREREELDRAGAELRQLSGIGLLYRRVSCDEALELEPALAPLAGRLSGAIAYESDESGDAHLYCLALARRTQAAGAEFRFGAEAEIEMHSGQVAAVIVNGERICADHYVVAAGSYSTLLMQQAGVRLPVRPAKGYSITFENKEMPPLLNRPIIDHHLHVVIVPFTDATRIAGTAEFAGYDTSLNPERIGSLLTTLRDLLPQRAWDAEYATPWCGLRPLSPDGVAIIGPTSVPNLWVNSGHGPLGWTCAAGSAQLLAQLMSGRPPSIDVSPYLLSRF